MKAIVNLVKAAVDKVRKAFTKEEVLEVKVNVKKKETEFVQEKDITVKSVNHFLIAIAAKI